MSESILRRFGERLKSIRTSKDISQEELAHRASLNRTYISLLERGKRNPSLVCIVSIADALEVPLHMLCDISDESN